MKHITRNRFIGLLGAALSLSMLVGCGSGVQNPNQTGTNNGTGSVSIAYLTPGLSLPYWQYLANGIQNRVKDIGWNATVQVYDSNNDANTQMKNAQDAISKHVDIIIISPTDSSSAPAVLSAAETAGIPVIIADVGTDSGTYAQLEITPNEDSAKEVGEYLGKTMQTLGMTDKTVGQITISQARSNGQARTKGFNEALAEYNIPTINLIQMSLYTRAEAKGMAQDMMTANPNLGAIFCQTDDPTLGVVDAVQGAGKASSVLVVGFDATPETVTAIQNGTLLAAEIQRPALMGSDAVDAAKQILAGQTVPQQVNVPALLVTKDNVNDPTITQTLATDVFPAAK